METECHENINVLLCPNCKERTPIVQVVSNKGVISLQFQCNCSIGKEIIIPLEIYLQNITALNKGEGKKCYRCLHFYHKDINAINALRHCVKCQEWICSVCLIIHDISCELLKNLYFQNHDKTFYVYCIDCKQLLCNKFNDHITHRTMNYDKN